VGKTSDWWKLALLLNDTQSVITLQSLLSFRLSLNLKELKSVIVRDHQQWFCDDFVDASSIDVFIDCGAFDGDTIESFINQTNDYSMIVGFEPSRKNFNLASARHKNEKIRLRNIVLSDSKGHVLFEDSDLMDASASDSPKAVYVESNYLDDELLNLLQNNQRIYLKIDVEGSESKLINGSKSLRTRYRPIIGIAAYHYWSDLFSLPFQLVTDAGPCSIGLRHYTESHFESVLYLCSQ
jgi:FkbM family methyltransferase